MHQHTGPDNARGLGVGVLIAGTCYSLTVAYRPDLDPVPPPLDVFEAVILSFKPS